MADEIREWIEKKRLKYDLVELFEQYDIDELWMLAKLKEEHLKEMGVSIGNRIKFFRAVCSCRSKLLLKRW